jgi:hypothetical protein
MVELNFPMINFLNVFLDVQSRNEQIYKDERCFYHGITWCECLSEFVLVVNVDIRSIT